MKITLLKSVLASGVFLEEGTEQEVSDSDGALLVRMGKAVKVEQCEVKPAKRKAKADAA